MGQRNKLNRFAQIKSFTNVFELDGKELLDKDFRLKGKWNRDFFNNDYPITLELGCGKGEYTVGLARRYSEKNFIGIDIKGERMWKGAKYALENQLSNVVFVRMRIEFIERLFGLREIQEIWVTFPDPYPKKPSNRLLSSKFLNRYKNIMIPDGLIHLKTDSQHLHGYTCAILKKNGIIPEIATRDLYSASQKHDEIMTLKTHYEKIFLAENKPITYLRFLLGGVDSFIETTKPWADYV